eukprot:884588-Rhodomonas_salina.3
MSRDLNALTVREIKEELTALGVNYEGCVERSDLVRKLQETQGEFSLALLQTLNNLHPFGRSRRTVNGLRLLRVTDLHPCKPHCLHSRKPSIPHAALDEEARGQAPANKDNGVAGFMNAMQGVHVLRGLIVMLFVDSPSLSDSLCPPSACSFANMTDSFAGMGVHESLVNQAPSKYQMKNVSDRFDKMEGKLDGLESQREQLRAKLGTPSQTALGRLNQLKASAGAREVESKLAETKDQCRVCSHFVPCRACVCSRSIP